MQCMIAPGSGVMRISRLQQAHHDASTRCVAPTALSCRSRPQQELPFVALGCMSSSNTRRPLAGLKAVQCPDREQQKFVGTISIGKDGSHRQTNDSPSNSSSNNSENNDSQRCQQQPTTANKYDAAAARSKLRHHLQQVLRPLQPAFKALNSVCGGVDPRVRGLVLLNIMTLLMGSNWVVIKSSNSAFDPVVFTSLRFTLAAAAFAPFLRQGLINPNVRKAGIEIGAWTALGYLCQSWALSMTPASRASLLSTFTVIAVPCLAGLSGQKVKPLVWGCGLAALIGTSLLEQGGGEPPNAGDVLSIVSALFFALQLFRTEQMSRQLPQGNAVSLMAVIISTVAAASLTSAAVVHWQDAAAAAGSLWNVIMSGVHAILPGDSGADSAEPLFELLYTSFCSTDLVLLIELMALQTVSSTEAALVYSMEPVSGALMAYAFLGERWGPLGWWGAAVIVAASVITQFGGALEADTPAAATAAADGTESRKP